ncbi:MAG: ComF family protein [Bacteroidales bacterium]|nr:ComF family protein [Bacteroidales bacterium]
MNLIDELLSIFYPTVCPVCGNVLFYHEKIICTRCFIRLPQTNFHLEDNNPVAKLFWGRANIEAASAMFYYRKGNRVQKLIHRFKYNSMREIGIFLGELYGKKLVDILTYKQTEIILPVPLHKKKEKIRGFNQSEIIANGLSKALGATVLTNVLIRTEQSSTQT